MTSVDAYLALGSNVGDRLDTLRSALREFARHPEAKVEDVSAVYETDPVSDVVQEPYLNLVTRVTTTLAPRELLALANGVEAAHGRDREREVRWGPRTLDVDVLLYGDDVIDDPGLTIPHPRLTQRAFVLVPLLEVMPGGALPDGTRLSEHLAKLVPLDGVRMLIRLTDVPGAHVARPAGPYGPPPSFERDASDSR